MTIALPHRWAPSGSGEGAAGRHEASWEGRHLTVRPAVGTLYLETVLADVFLDVLGDDCPDWLAPFEEARRTCLAADEIVAAQGPVLQRPGWTDRYVFSADLAHRLFTERRWNQAKPDSCLWIMSGAGTNDLLQGEQGRKEKPGRSNLAIAIERTRSWTGRGSPWEDVGAVSICNLFTARAHDLGDLSKFMRPEGAFQPATRPNHRLADRFLSSAVHKAGAVVGVWGSSYPDEQRHRPVQVEQLVREAGKEVHGLYVVSGERRRWLTNDQPRMTRGLALSTEPTLLSVLRADVDTAIA